MKITIANYTNIGDRSENEDSCSYLTNEKDDLIAVVADGLGGEGGGGKASMAAVNTVCDCFREKPVETAEDFGRWFEIANSKVLEMQTPACSMKTTLVVLQISDNIARWAHVGDSRLYHFVDGKIKERTFDHSVSQMAVLRGEITEDQIRGHVDRNKLLKAIGRAEGITAECSSDVNMNDGSEHAFLMCTDGFWELITEEEMERCLAGSKDVGEWLGGMAYLIGLSSKENKDNNTAIALIIK